MNVERINQLIERLESAPDEIFDMAEWGKGCGTPACIAGHTVQMFGTWAEDISEQAKDLLGLDWPDAWDLFVPEHKCLTQITKDEAIGTLKRLVQTGEVEW
ncbi:hypothetical protein ACUN0C_19065 [Faunimonas sp. B44]|uniref:hypothetical protein n=1 Tax=Faunimonas sp. B44 TaxID=3461493 RepID=UPI0040442FC5